MNKTTPELTPVVAKSRTHQETPATAERTRATEVKLRRADKILEVAFADGARFHLPAELLRVESPSAEVRGHGSQQKRLIAGRKFVGILGIEAVGHYAIRIRFDDLHDTGLYTWAYLRELGEKQDELFANYVAALTSAGLTREP
ncbi:MAG: DUF971 domain-containing protein [Alphaproteobacteria bacterium]|nr:DUF971 domain-containing protein [Alphaproteobacteria bacterium]